MQAIKKEQIIWTSSKQNKNNGGNKPGSLPKHTIEEVKITCQQKQASANHVSVEYLCIGYIYNTYNLIINREAAWH